MSKAEEATNDFCTRCFKYNRCTKAQSECVIADSYQEGFEDGYNQAEKDLELSWEDIPEIFRISEQLKTSWWFRDNEQTKLIGKQPFFEEVLKRFKAQKGNKLCRVYLTLNQKIGIANIALLSAMRGNQSL